MKTKNILIIALCLVLAAFVLGISGTVTLADGDSSAADGSERLIGVFITREPLIAPDFDRLVRENIQKLEDSGQLSEAEAAGYQKEGAIFATLKEVAHADGISAQEYVFEGIDGIRFFSPDMGSGDDFYHSLNADEGLTDAAVTFSGDDTEEKRSISGNLWVSRGVEAVIFYFNPVYQTADNRVFAVSGQGAALGSGGIALDQKLSDTKKTVSDGKEKALITEVAIHLETMEEPTGITILQFDEHNECLGKADYEPGTLPEKVDTLPGAQYLIVETASANETSRVLFQKDNTELCAFFSRKDRICLKQTAAISCV